MKKNLFLVLALVLFFTPHAFAQGNLLTKHLVQALKTGEPDATKRALQASAKEVALISRARGRAELHYVSQNPEELKTMQSALNRAVMEGRFSGRTHAAEKKMLPSLVQVVNVKTREMLSSGFVFEENRSGTPRLWAAVPYHVTGRAGNSVLLRLFRSDGSSVYYKVPVAVSGGYGFNALDMALCLLPPYAATHVQPIALALNSPTMGTVLQGNGFVLDDAVTKYLTGVTSYPHFTLVGPLSVSQAGGYKIKLPLRSQQIFHGACGSPYLDAQGRAAMMHAGSVSGKSVMGIDVVKGISALLDAYEGKKVVTPLGYLGKELGQLGITESISTIGVYRKGVLSQTIELARYDDFFNPLALEETLFAEPGDEIVIHIMEHRQPKRILRYQVP